ncbi:hypothetical protein PXK00_15355 [Phaeobacter sp. QD34_3]|uniref:hypothetical protein n=1 Tax=unclassified Phaeobacter TaxID=2621772 RepID=UPI00237FC7BC|nr:MULTISPECIES: hypothetical protein [unclassified Phaeobacter]MDE4134496.1 hypothetical protein [Phaeobacter sp. QD34_3]MDE4138114.1 hypothetical protein [Phaeobacter sp. QD34_24]MDE4176438.1 hypothetical protein [Phaeobacter sp. PT47_59]
MTLFSFGSLRAFVPFNASPPVSGAAHSVPKQAQLSLKHQSGRSAAAIRRFTGFQIRNVSYRKSRNPTSNPTEPA